MIDVLHSASSGGEWIILPSLW